jgi:hypothetical protein
MMLFRAKVLAPAALAVVAALLILHSAHAETEYTATYVATPMQVPAFSFDGVAEGGFFVVPDPSNHVALFTATVSDQVNGRIFFEVEQGDGQAHLFGTPQCFLGSGSISAQPGLGVWIFLQPPGTVYNCPGTPAGNAMTGTVAGGYSDS